MPVIATSERRRFQGSASSLSARLKPNLAISSVGTDEFGRPLATGWRALRARVWTLLDDPSSSTPARVIAIVVMTLIVVSVASFCLETLPAFREGFETMWFAIEAACIAVFTVEYLGRLLTCPQLWSFVKAPLNVIDLVAIAPFYFSLLLSDSEGSGSAIFRVVRLVRVFRVFKISRYVSWVKMFANALGRSAQPLGMLAFIMSIGCVLFSSAIYLVERGEWDESTGVFVRHDGTESPFSSIPASFWWAVITMTTVGYGDVVPITFGGRVVAVVTSLAGILVLAIPITVISTNFNQEYDMMKREKEMTQRRLVLLKNQFKLRQRGLEALQDELEDLVNATSSDFRNQVNEVVEETRGELTNEVRELVRVAYESREELQDQYVAARERMRREGGHTPGATAGLQAVAEAELARMKQGRGDDASHASNDLKPQPTPPEQPLPGPSSRTAAASSPAVQSSAPAGLGAAKE